MPTENKSTSKSLANFDFDNETSFFDIPASNESATDQVIKEVKGDPSSTKSGGVQSSDLSSGTNADPLGDDEDIDEEEPTFFGEEPKEKAKKEAPTKTKAEAPKKTTQDDSSDEGEDEGEEDDDEGEEEDEKAGKKGKQTKEAPKKTEAGAAEDLGDDDELTDKQKEVKFFTQAALDLKERGILRFVEVKEGDEIDEEKFFELNEQDHEKALDEEFTAFVEELKSDQDAADFIAFKRNGGKTADFFKTYAEATAFDTDEIDIKNEKQRDKLIDHYLTHVEQLDEDDIASRKEWLKEEKKEEKYAAKYLLAIKSANEQKKKALLEGQKENNEEGKRDQKAFRQELLTSVEEDIKVGIIPIKKSEVKDLADFISKPTVKIKGNQFIPELQSRIVPVLRAKTKDDILKLMAIAKILKADFKPEDVATSVKSTVVKKVKSRLGELKSNPNLRGSGSSQKRERSLVENFSD